ncbi:biotin/lipoyl-binding protein, partial [candidate division WOR-3 bacterium]|nr:biotin/lipoyl-binding protein [candidate division WOR-3 bacterium]
MSRTLRRAAVPAIVIAVLCFVVFALLRSAPKRSAPPTPDLEAAPVRIYGTVEPAGGPVYVAATVSRSVVSVPAREGDTVAAGQPLVRLESAVESAQLAAAVARAEAAERAWAIRRDAFRRNAELFAARGISEVEYSESRLRAELDSATLTAARAEAGLARARLDQLTLSAPAAGIVYKLDVRLGQTLAAGDDSRIVTGPRCQQVRLFAESFWLGRL